jgi:hypothetical protein
MVAEHWLVWPVWRLVATQETVTDAMVGEGGGVVVCLVTPPQPESNRNARNDRLSKVLRLMACPHRGSGRFEKDEVILWRWRVEVFRKAEALFAFGNVPKGVGGMQKRNGWESGRVVA